MEMHHVVDVVVVVSLTFCVTAVISMSVHELPKTPPMLLLVSLDGFRHDYLDMFKENETANFQYFIKNGVKAKHVINVFPSVTFPNHMTLLTGVYPETHGVTHNNFYDPKLNDTFFMHTFYQNLEPKWFDNGAEPIWVTNQKSGLERKSGSLMWPGGLTTVKCIQPKVLSHTYLYNSTQQISYKQRIDYIIKWFTDKKEPINLGLLYFPEPDEVGHQYGPASKEVKEEILKIDAALGHLRTELDAHGLLDKMNIILTADHGMAEVGKSFINLDEYLKPDTYTTPINLSLGYNMVIPQLVPRKGFETQVSTALSRIKNLYVYHKNTQQLKDLHYNDNDRIMPIVLEPKNGYLIGNNISIARFKQLPNSGMRGAHGYDPAKVPEIHPFFIASGPAFKKGLISNPIHMVDIYSLMCHILKVKPAPNNGSLENVKHLLVEEPEKSPLFQTTTITFFLVVLVTALVSGVFVIGVVRQSYIMSRRRTPQHRMLVKPVSSSGSPSRGTHSLLSSDDDDDDEF